MTTITKQVNRMISVGDRSQFWSSTVDRNDSGGVIAAGDRFDLETSLGYAAKEMTLVVAGGSMSIRRNTQITIFPRFDKGMWGGQGHDNFVLKSGYTITDTTQSPTIIPAGTTYTFNATEIKTLDIVTLSGTFTLEVA